MNEISTKLDKIITKMDNIADRLSNVEVSVATLKSSLSIIEDEFEDRCKKIKNIDDKVTNVDLNEVIGRVNDLEQCSSHRDCKLENLTQKLNDFVHFINMKEQKNKSNKIMQELYSKRLNLLIHGLKENEMYEFESRNETYALFTKFLQEALGLGPDSIQLADIHQLPQHTIFKNGKRTTRPIIIKLSSVFNKNIILKSWKKLKSYNLKLSSNMGDDFEYVYVTEHLLKNLQLQKKRLLPAFKQAKSERKRAIWQIENAEYRLYVEGRKVID